jgi:hypothetical protein
VQPNKQAVIQMIEAAFDGVPRPEEITLHVAEARDLYDYDNDAQHRAKDRHIDRWQDVPDEHLHDCTTALSYLEADGMRYYLPAYMTWYLRHFGTNRVNLDSVLYALGPPDDPSHPPLHEGERYRLFTPEQWRACAAFVRYCAEDETQWTDVDYATGAYLDYWHAFDPFPD